MSLLLVASVLLGPPAALQEDEPRVLPRVAAPEVDHEVRRLSMEESRASLERAVGFLIESQTPEGTWGSQAPDCLLELGFALETYYSWQVGAHALGTMALAAGPDEPRRRAALDRAVEWLIEARPSTRGADWDVDKVWSTLYGFVACVELLEDPRLKEGELGARLDARGREFLSVLLDHQSEMGGWAYYDDPPYDRVQTWATSFCTALVLPSLVRAKERGWDLEQRVIDRALKYVQRCMLPNGAYEYDLNPQARLTGIEHINRIEGSLGRTQVCHWARLACGDERVTAEDVEAGLGALFQHHGFLDHARTRPVPHEGFHANAGYFYFFAHYYAAKVINTLPEARREEWHALLRPHITKTQWTSGAMSDFMDAGYALTSATAFSILALEEGMKR